MEQLIIEDKTYKRSVKVGKHRVGGDRSIRGIIPKWDYFRLVNYYELS
jgi:hypothetical protein